MSDTVHVQEVTTVVTTKLRSEFSGDGAVLMTVERTNAGTNDKGAEVNQVLGVTAQVYMGRHPKGPGAEILAVRGDAKAAVSLWSEMFADCILNNSPDVHSAQRVLDAVAANITFPFLATVEGTTPVDNAARFEAMGLPPELAAILAAAGITDVELIEGPDTADGNDDEVLVLGDFGRVSDA